MGNRWLKHGLVDRTEIAMGNLPISDEVVPLIKQSGSLDCTLLPAMHGSDAKSQDVKISRQWSPLTQIDGWMAG
jgi:hypothetical protein